MNECLLQFIWQFQYFNKHGLCTTAGELLLIRHPGTLNRHQGPDFFEAAISIGTTLWIGNIELHLRASDWNRHHHADDLHYRKIILHVVWQEDEVLYDLYGNIMPTLVLEHRIAGSLLHRYRHMMENPLQIPCASFLPALSELAWYAWKERLAAERLERKAGQVLNSLQHCGNDWEEVCWRLMAANFGIKVNAALFEQVAISLPIRLLAKHRSQAMQLEALLLGQANLLTGKQKDHYFMLLQREYFFLQKKYKLTPVAAQPAFLRMRPASFPTIRLSQLAVLLNRTPQLFSNLTDAKNVKQLLAWFAGIGAREYWQNHYRPGGSSGNQVKYLGKQMAENIVINTAIPLLFANAHYQGVETEKANIFYWLYHLRAEQNHITRSWQRSGITVRSAMDSQAVIELSNNYCMAKRCLECAVGNRILNL